MATCAPATIASAQSLPGDLLVEGAEVCAFDRQRAQVLCFGTSQGEPAGRWKVEPSGWMHKIGSRLWWVGQDVVSRLDTVPRLPPKRFRRGRPTAVIDGLTVWLDRDLLRLLSADEEELWGRRVLPPASPRLYGKDQIAVLGPLGVEYLNLTSGESESFVRWQDGARYFATPEIIAPDIAVQITPTELVALSMRSGEILWKEESFGGSGAIACFDGIAAWLDSGQAVRFLDRFGHRKWVWNAQRKLRSVRCGTESLVTEIEEGDKARIVALDRKGRAHWSRAAKRGLLEVADGRLFHLAEGKITARSLASGAELWQRAVRNQD